MEREKSPQGCKGGRGGRDQNLREKHRIFGRTMKGKMEILSDRKGEKKSPVLKAKTAPFWGALLTAPPSKQHFGAKAPRFGSAPAAHIPIRAPQPRISSLKPHNWPPTPPASPPTPHPSLFTPSKPHPEPQTPPPLKARHPPNLTFRSEPDDFFLAPRFSPPPPPYKAGEGERGGGQQTGRG